MCITLWFWFIYVFPSKRKSLTKIRYFVSFIDKVVFLLFFFFFKKHSSNSFYVLFQRIFFFFAITLSGLKLLLIIKRENSQENCIFVFMYWSSLAITTTFTSYLIHNTWLILIMCPTCKQQHGQQNNSLSS